MRGASSRTHTRAAHGPGAEGPHGEGDGVLAVGAAAEQAHVSAAAPLSPSGGGGVAHDGMPPAMQARCRAVRVRARRSHAQPLGRAPAPAGSAGPAVTGECWRETYASLPFFVKSAAPSVLEHAAVLHE